MCVCEEEEEKEEEEEEVVVEEGERRGVGLGSWRISDYSN